MCPSSWKLYLDDFPFLGSSLAHLEPKLELFEFWEFGSWWLIVARLSPIYVLFAFKIFLLPVPTRPGTRPFLQVPDPSRPEVKNPYPSDPEYEWDSDDDDTSGDLKPLFNILHRGGRGGGALKFWGLFDLCLF